MSKIEISVQMEDQVSAHHLHGYLMGKGVEASIVDGAKVVASDDVGAGTLIAAHFFDFLNER